MRGRRTWWRNRRESAAFMELASDTCRQSLAEVSAFLKHTKRVWLMAAGILIGAAALLNLTAARGRMGQKLAGAQATARDGDVNARSFVRAMRGRGPGRQQSGVSGLDADRNLSAQGQRKLVISLAGRPRKRATGYSSPWRMRTALFTTRRKQKSLRCPPGFEQVDVLDHEQLIYPA